MIAIPSPDARAVLTEGTVIDLRSLREADLAHAREYFDALSADSRHARFMGSLPDLTTGTLEDVVHAMHAPGHAVSVATVATPAGPRFIGGVRVVPTGRAGTGEFALSIIDAWQGRGVGRILLAEALRLAAALGYRDLEGIVLTSNVRMLGVARRLGFVPHPANADPSVTIVSRAVSP